MLLIRFYDCAALHTLRTSAPVCGILNEQRLSPWPHDVVVSWMDVEKYHTPQLIHALGFQDLKQSLMVNKKEDNCEFGGWQLQSSRESGLIFFPGWDTNPQANPTSVSHAPAWFSSLNPFLLLLASTPSWLPFGSSCSMPTIFCQTQRLDPHSSAARSSILKWTVSFSHLWERLSKHNHELWLGYQGGMWEWKKDWKCLMFSSHSAKHGLLISWSLRWGSAAKIWV